MLNGGAGNDKLYGGTGDDNIQGGDGNDTIYGGAGSDTIRTGSGADVVHSGAGTDYIVNTADSDVDTFIFDVQGTDALHGFDVTRDKMVFDTASGLDQEVKFIDYGADTLAYILTDTSGDGIANSGEYMGALLYGVTVEQLQAQPGVFGFI